MITPSAISLPAIMPSDAVKTLQQKLFRGAEDTSGIQQTDSRDPGLTIQIPKVEPAASPKLPTKASKTAPSDLNGTQENDSIKSYRQRLSESLGADYHGVEKYRLLQDQKRERHWKRWGPYLSDRQWVRAGVHGCPRADDVHIRQLFGRTTQRMVTPGATSLMNTPDPVRTGGAKTELVVSQIAISGSASHLLFGTRRTRS